MFRNGFKTWQASNVLNRASLRSCPQHPSPPPRCNTRIRMHHPTLSHARPAPSLPPSRSVSAAAEPSLSPASVASSSATAADAAATQAYAAAAYALLRHPSITSPLTIACTSIPTFTLMLQQLTPPLSCCRSCTHRAPNPAQPHTRTRTRLYPPCTTPTIFTIIFLTYLVVN